MKITLTSALQNGFRWIAKMHPEPCYQERLNGMVSFEFDGITLSEFADAVGSHLDLAMSVKKAIAAAEQRLETARFGLEDMKRGGAKFHSGMMNAVVFGRMVTFALQNIRSSAEYFDVWYSKKQEEMKSDKLMRFFYELRTEIEKRAENPTGKRGIINLNVPRDLSHFDPAPPGAISIFIGDRTGGSGWKILRPDGQIEKYYIELPKSIVDIHVTFRSAPEELAQKTPVELIEEYLNRLDALIREAKERFLK